MRFSNPLTTAQAKLNTSTKKALVRIGSICGDGMIHSLNSCVSYLEVGSWMKAQGFHPFDRLECREGLFDKIASRIQGKQTLYLELGVASGDSFRYWSNLLKGADDKLHGFDTFEGLPFDWQLRAKKGAFSTGGSTPNLEDARAEFFKGLFEETLPHYSPPKHDVLVINIDCDLYTSALYALTQLKAHIQPGTYLYFDEFCDRNNELRAFRDFLAISRRQFGLVGATETLRHVAFECMA